MLRSVLRRLVFAAIVAAASGCSGGAGRQLISTGISSYDRQVILDAHNHLRQSVALGRVPGQPGAANMMQMVWDDELAAKAQQWADTCGHGHDPGRHVARFRVGQNIARSWTWPRPDSLGATSEFERQIHNWFDEVSGYRYHGSSAAGTGHYSQLIWGDSYLVGCGYSYFQDPHQGYTKLYVCNYGPGGNIRGYTPYQSGSPSCEAYGSSPSSEYSGLCYPPGHGGFGSNSFSSTNSYGSNNYGSSNFGSSGYGSNSQSGSGYGSNSQSGSGYGSNSYGSSNFGSSGYGSNSLSGSGYGSNSLGSSSSSFGSHGFGSTGFGSNTFGSNSLGSSSLGGSSGFGSSSLGSSFGSHSLGSTDFGSHSLGSYSFGSHSLGSTGFGSNGFGSSGYSSNGFGSNGYGSNSFASIFGASSRGYWK